MADLGRIGASWMNELQVGDGVMGGKRILNEADYMKSIEWMTPANFASSHPWIANLTDDVRARIEATTGV